MTSRTLFTAVALATLSFLTACGGGDGADGGQAQASSIGGIGGSGVTSQGIGGIGGSGIVAQGVGGIGGSGMMSQGIGGIGGSGIASVASVPLKTCSLSSVNVTIAAARVNPDPTADAGGAGWIDVAPASPVRVNLLALSAGGTLPLDMTTLPDGHYRQMRLLLVADDASTPLADSIVTSDNSAELALAVPSTAQGGLPLRATVTVADGQVTASYADVDACAGVSATGGVYALDAAASGATQLASAY